MLVTKEAQAGGLAPRASGRPDRPSRCRSPSDDVGDIYVNIAFLKDDRLYRAEKRLTVPAVSRQLQVTVAADQPVAKPRQPATFTVTVTRRRPASPVRAQLSLGVIDEAVYGVKPDTTADPLRFFYRREYSRVGTEFSRDYSFVGYVRHRAAAARAAAAADRRSPTSRATGRRGRRCARSSPTRSSGSRNLVTDADGTATVQRRLPGRAHDVAAHGARGDAGHAGRRGGGADDDDQGPDRARRHAALPHRGRRGRPCRPSCTTTCRRPRR